MENITGCRMASDKIDVDGQKVYRVWDQRANEYWHNGKIWLKRGHAQAALRLKFDDYGKPPISEQASHLAIREYRLVLTAEVRAEDLLGGMKSK